MNASAVVIFIWRAQIAWHAVLYVSIAAILGGQLGVFFLRRINETALRVGITLIGLGLTIGLLIRQ
jgi:uncharacterized membrane protein YfcA